MKRSTGVTLAMVVAMAATTACKASNAGEIGRTPDQKSPPPPATPGGVKLLDRTTSSDYQRHHQDQDIDAWHRRVPATEVVRIRSSADGKMQRAVFYDSGSDRPRPLLVVLHSWSADYEQNLDIPFAEFAIANDWVFVHPDFRGPNQRPEATASDLAVQDVLDAVAYARQRATVDRARVYLAGYSGGAMKALVLAGRHPELWGGVVAWGPIYDIADWYRHDHGDDIHYRTEIAASCGGVPRPGSAAEAECRARSPLSHLARAAGRVPVLIAHGLRDTTVPPRHALRAYDALAAPADRFTAEQRAIIDGERRIPPELRSSGGTAADPLFDRVGAPVRLTRQSRAVTLVLFKGGHEVIYNPPLRWLAEQRRPGG